MSSEESIFSQWWRMDKKQEMKSTPFPASRIPSNKCVFSAPSTLSLPLSFPPSFFSSLSLLLPRSSVLLVPLTIYPNISRPPFQIPSRIFYNNKSLGNSFLKKSGRIFSPLPKLSELLSKFYLKRRENFPWSEYFQPFIHLSMGKHFLFEKGNNFQRGNGEYWMERRQQRTWKEKRRERKRRERVELSTGPFLLLLQLH